MTRFLAMFLLLCTGLPLKAEPLYGPKGQIGSVTPVAGFVQDGHTYFGIRITLHPGWKTYFREPGSSGIPPRIIVKNTELEGLSAFWPTPKLLTSPPDAIIGYEKELLLPFAAKGSSAGPVELSLDLGICEQVCIPVHAEISTPIGAPEAALQQAIAHRMQRQTAQDAKVTTCDISLEDKKAIVSLHVQRRDTLYLALTPPSPAMWVRALPAQPLADGQLLRSEINLIGDGPMVLAKNQLDFTLIDAKGAVWFQGC